MTQAYDPLDYQNLARSIVNALLETKPTTLPPMETVGGSGVYALYYCGSLPFYASVASPECHTPIYVGKAVPSGARKGRTNNLPGSGTELHRRLRDHSKSIDQAQNLSVNDLKCRYLIVVPVWITLAERFLITHFQPLWNTVIDGFGNHAPGRGRRDMRRPRWDIVHPGRNWAALLQAEETLEDIFDQLNRKNQL